MKAGPAHGRRRSVERVAEGARGIHADPRRFNGPSTRCAAARRHRSCRPSRADRRLAACWPFTWRPLHILATVAQLDSAHIKPACLHPPPRETRPGKHNRHPHLANHTLGPRRRTLAPNTCILRCSGPATFLFAARPLAVRRAGSELALHCRPVAAQRRSTRRASHPLPGSPQPFTRPPRSPTSILIQTLDAPTGSRRGGVRRGRYPETSTVDQELLL
jgi:hypothetical protein